MFTIIKEEKLNKDVLTLIKSIDDDFYKEEILTLDWYLKRYKEFHNGILLYDGNKCVGYLVGVPVKKEFYDEIMSGKLTNDLYVNPNMFVDKSNYNYIASIVIKDKYRNKGYAHKMMDKLIENKKSIFFALAITDDGNKFASKYMNKVIEVNDEVNVYELVLE